MSAAIPERIQKILAVLNKANVWIWDLHRFTTPRGCDLTNTLCPKHKLDFISMYRDDAYLFTCDKNSRWDKNCTWQVKYIGAPVYYVEPKMVGDEVDFEKFLTELKSKLPSVDIKSKSGAALRNNNSRFVRYFNKELNRAVQSALNNL